MNLDKKNMKTNKNFPKDSLQAIFQFFFLEMRKCFVIMMQRGKL